MSRPLIILMLLPITSALAVDWLEFFSGELRETNRQLAEVRAAMLVPQHLPAPPAEQGFQLYGVTKIPRVAPWVQLDLGRVTEVDTIALIPAVESRGGRLEPFGFPNRLRVDGSETADFRKAKVLDDHTEVPLAARGLEPMIIPAGGKRMRFIRITVPGLAVSNKHLFFALGEVLVLRGNLNLSTGARVTASDMRGLPPAWDVKHLVDGKSALGPPLLWTNKPVEWTQNGITARGGRETPPSMCIDLGQSYRLDEVRLHGMISSVFGSLDLRFPVSLKVELSEDAEISQPIIVYDGSGGSQLSPAGNTVYLPADGAQGRYLRLLGQDGESGPQFTLSEIQVYAGGINVALGKQADALPVKTGVDRGADNLVDGRTTRGILMELPEWLAQWQTWAAQRDHVAALEQRQTSLMARTQTRLMWGAVTLAALLLLGTAAGFLTMRARRRRDLAALRDRLARDLHDEIGSSLAGIAMLSETAGADSHLTTDQREDWQQVRRAAVNTSQAMREVLWLIGARQESGGDLLTQLRHTAERLLQGHALTWAAPDQALNLPGNSAREIMLAFKEALANILRHAPGAAVSIEIVTAPLLQITIQDHGPGMDVAKSCGGIGLASIQQRLKSIGGSAELSSSSTGTTLTFRVPIQTS